MIAAQVLLSPDDTETRKRWLNARATLERLIALGVIPVINENDTVATEEIRYGDNDRLAARVAQMIGADLLVLLSDIDGLYSSDPRRNVDASHIPLVSELTPEIDAMAGGMNTDAGVGSGGMATKLAAARIAASAGCATLIALGAKAAPLNAVEAGDRATLIAASTRPGSPGLWRRKAPSSSMPARPPRSRPASRYCPPACVWLKAASKRATRWWCATNRAARSPGA
jgi:glutamate 5-kinase